MQEIKVAVSGAFGNMGREVCRAVCEEKGFKLVGAVDVRGVGTDIGQLLGLEEARGIKISSAARDLYREVKPQVVIDFTNPLAVMENIETILRCGARAVVGTTGITTPDLEKVRKWVQEEQLGAVIAPNFALGAVLMMHCAALCSRYMDHVEIIELHHDGKMDAPSGTALKTAEMIATSRKQSAPAGEGIEEIIKLPGARGGEKEGIHVHSVRLPGLVAHQEVIFGALGQSLTIRHDSFHRRSFMPGIMLAARKVMELNGLVYGLEKLLDL